MAIHPQAIVDPKAQIHETAEIGPFCIIGAGVRIEAGCDIRNNVTIYSRATIGAGTTIFPGVVIASEPQFLDFKGEDSEVVIGRECCIHEYVTINKGTARGGMTTRVGDHCLIMAYAHLAHDCQLADHVVIGNNAQLAGHVKVGRKVIISGMTGVHHFVTVGELAFIGAMSGLRVDVPPYLMVDGIPAEPRNVNVVGLRRDGWSEEDVRAMKDAFRSLFHDRNGKNLVDLLGEVPTLSFGRCAGVLKLCDWLSAHMSHNRKGRHQEALRH